MKHPSTQSLFAYWTKQRGSRPAPDRADIDPADIRHALGDTIMLAADFVDQLRFRLAGTRVCALFCRELKGEAFAALWSETSAKKIEDLLAIVTNEQVSAVAGFTGRTADGDSLDLEILLLPLAHSGLARIRAIGVLAPLVPPYWLGEKPLVELELGTLRHIDAEADRRHGRRFATVKPNEPAAVEDVRVRHGFVVYSGGRTAPPGERTG